MNPLKILIVEDEPIIAKDLSYMLKDIGYSIVGIKYNAKDAIDCMATNKPDLVMLDINIEGDKDGIMLAHDIKEKFGTPFIFLTSYADNSTIKRAKATQPLGYLIKPIDEKDLISTIEVSMYNFNNRIQVLPKEEEQSKVIFIRTGNHHSKANIDEIIYVEAQNNYSYIHTKEKKFLISSTLKVVEARLTNFGFKRIHRSYLINPEFIIKLEDGCVCLPGIALPFGKKYKKEFYDNMNFL